MIIYNAAVKKVKVFFITILGRLSQLYGHFGGCSLSCCCILLICVYNISDI